MMCSRKSALLIGAAVIASGWVSAVYAQQAADPTQPEGAGAAADIVVTAQKRAERLSDVPMSVSAASGEQLAQLGVTDIGQLTKVVPGFTFQTSNTGFPIYGIRGISFFDNSTIANPAVSVYVDQIPLPFSSLTRAASMDIERVEVLKGPQGTLFGQNATGGAINYIAAKPTSEISAGGSVSYGRFNEVRADAHVGGPLTSTLGIRVSGMGDWRDNWQQSTTRDEGNGNRDFFAGRVLLEWKPSSSVDIVLNVNGWRDRSDTQTSQFVRFAPTSPNGAYRPPFIALSNYGPVPTNARQTDFDPGLNLARDDDFWQASLNASFEVTPDITLNSLTSYLEFNQNSPVDGDGTNYLDIQSQILAHVRTFNQELRLAGHSGPVRWMIGGSLDRQDLFEDARSKSAGTNSLLAGVLLKGLSSFNDQSVDTVAGFGSLDLELGNVTLQASGRYTAQDRDFEGCTRDLGDGSANAFSSTLTRIFTGAAPLVAPGRCTTVNAATFQPVPWLNRSLDEDNFSWRLGADWKITPNNMIYANVTKGFKAGSFTTIPLTFSNQATQVRQESLLAYEAGFKSALWDRRVNVTGAVFYYDYHDKQTLGTVPVAFLGAFPALVNVPRSSVKGVELSFDFRPVPQLKLNVGGTYLETKVKDDFTLSDPLGRVVNVKGEALPNTPKWQIAGDAQYDVALGSSLKCFVGTTLTYKSSAFSNFGEVADLLLPAYTLLDLRAGVSDANGKWRVQVWGRNVTNKYYLTNAGRTIDTVYRFVGMPATYGVTVGFNY